MPEQSEFDSLIGTGDYVFPETEVTDEEAMFPEAKYHGVIGRLLPFFVGADGKKANPNDPNKRLFNAWLELWVLKEMKNYDTPAQINVPRITISDGNVDFWRKDARGVKILESFVMPANPLFEKLNWKSKIWFSKFPGVILGEVGKKKIMWEKIKQMYGRPVLFDIVYSEGKGKKSQDRYRNIMYVEPEDGTLDVLVMQKVEEKYNKIKEELAKAKASPEKKVDSNLDDVLPASSTSAPSAPIIES